jgi:hypothetical protein
MRALADADRIRRFMRALGSTARQETRAYLTGGATAVLLGWRRSTIDVDITFEPDRDEVLRAIPALKEDLQLNIELAAPSHFLPELPGWRGRSAFIDRVARVSFYHYDFYSQALSKIERGHAQDRADVESMLRTGLVVPATLRDLYEAIVPDLYRYPAVDPRTLRRMVDDALAEHE